MIKDNIPSAEEALIHQVQHGAAAENRTPNEAFQQRLEWCIAQLTPSEQYELLMQRLSHVNAGRKFSRGETNERQ